MCNNICSIRMQNLFPCEKVSYLLHTMHGHGQVTATTPMLPKEVIVGSVVVYQHARGGRAKHTHTQTMQVNESAATAVWSRAISVLAARTSIYYDPHHIQQHAVDALRRECTERGVANLTHLVMRDPHLLDVTIREQWLPLAARDWSEKERTLFMLQIGTALQYVRVRVLVGLAIQITGNGLKALTEASRNQCDAAAILKPSIEQAKHLVAQLRVNMEYVDHVVAEACQQLALDTQTVERDACYAPRLPL